MVCLSYVKSKKDCTAGKNPQVTQRAHNRGIATHVYIGLVRSDRARCKKAHPQIT